MKFIHIAGTNGKGSVTLKISKALELNKYKVGTYTSPHLFKYTERIKINSECIQ
jgi:dihydrofolate synthase/folylpolyglutamate synthase